MKAGRFVGRIGALAAALGVGDLRRGATGMAVPIGVAAVAVTATIVSAQITPVSPTVELSADSTALIVCGTSCPTPDAYWIDSVRNNFIAPTHPSQDIDYVPVTTPQEYWPITGFARLIAFAVGDPKIGRPGGAMWPDEPWWKLSGLFDLTIDQSIRAGAADLEAAMAEHGDDHLVINGYSQGATVVNTVKRKLAEQYPAGTDAPDIDFVLGGDPNLPNGGLSARFPGLYVPILDLTFDGPAPTDTQFDTVEISRQYDMASDFPLYPLNVIAVANAVLGFLYLHTNPFDVSLPDEPMTSPAYQGTHGDTSYYFFETENLPLFAPLRSIGVPEPLIDVVEPFFRVLVELGYDRDIPLWEPTPARLIPELDPAKVIADLVHAIGEGADNALALVGLPPLPRIPAPVTGASPVADTATADADAFDQVASKMMPTQTEQVMSTEPTTEPREISTETATSTTESPFESDPAASASSATNTEQPMSLNSADALTSKPAKSGPLVRNSLRADQLPSAQSESGQDDQPTSRAAAASDETANGEPSSTGSTAAGSAAADSSVGGGSSDGGSSGSAGS